MPIYSIVKELRRGERLMGEEPRAQRTVRLWDWGRLAYRDAAERLVARRRIRVKSEPLI